MYDHFAKGSLDNSSDQFEVDFASKRDLEHGHKRDSCTDDGDAFDTDTDGHDKKNGNGGDQRREVIDELEAQTRQGRVKAAAAKFERESFESKKRKRLKLEFLKRRLQKSKSSVHL